MPEQMVPEGDEDAAVADVDADALTTLVLEVLGPALAWWRVEAARRLELDATSFDCLDLLRRQGRVPSGTVGERTGLTRSSVSKLLRRLESAGHVELFRAGERGLVFEARLRPHAERDAELARMREELRFRLRYVATYGVDERGRSAAVQLLRNTADSLATVTMASVDRAAEARRLEARRRRDAENGALGW